MTGDPEVLRAASLYQLGLPRMPVSGRSGELLGRGTGTSLEFQEYREYTPGDDIRHLDWAAYARSDHLMVRLFREEISPRMEIVLDVSRSMSTSPEKMLLARQLAGLFAHLSASLGSRPLIWLAGDDRPAQSLRLEAMDSANAIEFEAAGTLENLLDDHGLPMRRQAVRIVISDFLFPHQPDRLIRRLAGEASVLWAVQVLTKWEQNPDEAGGTRLIDAESGMEADLYLSQKVIAEYRARLLALQQELALHCRRYHATFATTIADQGLASVCREELSRCGILRAT